MQRKEKLKKEISSGGGEEEDWYTDVLCGNMQVIGNGQLTAHTSDSI
jgi:hypothetical protein